MIITIPNSDLCNNRLEVQSTLGGIELPPKICTLPKGHDGVHSNGSAVWLNLHRRIERMNREGNG